MHTSALVLASKLLVPFAALDIGSTGAGTLSETETGSQSKNQGHHGPSQTYPGLGLDQIWQNLQEAAHAEQQKPATLSQQFKGRPAG